MKAGQAFLPAPLALVFRYARLCGSGLLNEADSRHGGGPLIGQTGISSYPHYTPFPCGIRDQAELEEVPNARYYIHTDAKNGGNWWGVSWGDDSLVNGDLIFRVNGVSVLDTIQQQLQHISSAMDVR